MIVLYNAESILSPQATSLQGIYTTVDKLALFNNICPCVTSYIHESLGCFRALILHKEVPRNCSRTQIRLRDWPRNPEWLRPGTFPGYGSPYWEFTAPPRPSPLPRLQVPVETEIFYSILSNIGNNYPEVIA